MDIRRSHHYVAVGSMQSMTTLLELLKTLQLHTTANQQLSVAVACSSRDILDEVVCALQASSFAVTALHSDLTDKELDFQAAAFRRQLTTSSEEAGHSDAAGDDQGSSQAGSHSQAGAGPGHGLPAQPLCLALAFTDVCLKALNLDKGHGFGVSLLIQYELPHKKDLFNLRCQAVFGAAGQRRQVVISFIQAGQVEKFRAMERFLGLLGAQAITEMPVHVGDVFAQT